MVVTASQEVMAATARRAATVPLPQECTALPAAVPTAHPGVAVDTARLAVVVGIAHPAAADIVPRAVAVATVPLGHPAVTAGLAAVVDPALLVAVVEVAAATAGRPRTLAPGTKKDSSTFGHKF